MEFAGHDPGPHDGQQDAPFCAGLVSPLVGDDDCVSENTTTPPRGHLVMS